MKKPKKIKELKLKVIDGKINTYGQTKQYDEFLKQREGLFIKLIPYDPYSNDIRRYFEGAIIEYFQLQHFQYSKKEGRYVRVPRDYVRKMLKREFNGEYIPTLDGKFVREGISTAGLSKKQFTAFVERIINYMETNGMMIPYSDDFNNWLDTSPPLKAVYPPLKELRIWSDEKLKELNRNYG